MSGHLLSAAGAAERLGIKRETLYAYVSRGRLTAHRRDDHPGSWFDPVELDALAGRARDPAERRPALRITSGITLIERGQYWYRGREPADLAGTRSFEAVAELLWTDHDEAAPPAWEADREAAARARTAQHALPEDVSATDRLRVVVAVLGATDPFRFDLRPEGAVATARRLLATTMVALTGHSRPGTVADALAQWLAPHRTDAAQALDAALVLMADHELAASTLAVRVAASFRADPYAAVSAGLGALGGAWHGAASRQVEALLDEVTQGRTPGEVLGLRLRGGQPVPGFDHPLYPRGDPRAPILLEIARTLGSTAAADALLKTAAARHLPPPNADFGLAALALALGPQRGAGEAIFAVGRLAGWLAHAIEEYRERSDLRLRALYNGPRP